MSMRKIKEVLRLRFELRLGQREIARGCSISQGAVHNYLKRAAAAGIAWPLPEGWDEQRVEQALFGERQVVERLPEQVLPDFAALHSQLQQHRHLTLQLAWEEYRQVHPEGYGYSRFCGLYQRWRRKQDVVLRQVHKPAEKGFVDSAGATIPELGFLDRLALLVDQQWNWRQNQALTRRVLAARLRGAACVENIDYRAERGLNRSVMRALAQESAWVANHEHIFVLGPTGVGKSYVASALAQKACRDGYRVYYTRAAALFRDLSLARADGSLRQLLRRLNRIDVLVVDDWVMAPMSEPERRDFWEIAEDRYQTHSMILTSQLPVSRWHEQIGDPTLADGILDRLVHNAHRIEMRGDSMRKKKGEKEEK